MVEERHLVDFTPFVARFRTYKRDLSDANKIALMSTGMESLRDSVHMKGLIERSFDFERDIALVKSEIFDQPDRMDVVFNYIDLFPVTLQRLMKHTISMLHICTHSLDTMTKKQVLI